MRFFPAVLASLFVSLMLTGCLTRRTVTEGGQVIEKDYVIKRPLKEIIQNSEP